jgi:uncharacterized membrane protein
MNPSASTTIPNTIATLRRSAPAVATVVLAAAMGAVLLAVMGGMGRLPQAGRGDRLTDVLSKTIESQGVDAAVAQFRSLREKGFPGLHESESDTNALGYALLGKGANESAIQVLRLNAETHPRSANVHDSLGEAYLAAGNKALAIESYRKALAIDPKLKSALAEMQRLTGVARPPYRPIVLVHILGGIAGILSGAVALCLRKGSPRHAFVGRVFVVSMLIMSGTAAYRAYVAPNGQPINLYMAVLTFYLVLTAWIAGRRRNGGTGPLEWASLLAIVAVAVGLVRLGLSQPRFAGVTLFFGAVASIAAVLDIRNLVRGGVTGTSRLVRHLWRMIAAFYIAGGSFFLGQAQLFPYAVRKSGLLFVPSVLIVLSLVFWLIRVLFTKPYKRAAPPVPPLAGPHIAPQEG